MKTLIHISDLHYGRIDESITGKLVSAFSKIKPDLVVISGDLTQRARTSEFQSAKAFLGDLSKAGMKYFVIPGNHDLEPLFKPHLRIVNPYKNYRKFISEELEPIYHDNEIAVIGINTVRSSNIKDGGINLKQIKKVQGKLSSFPKDITRIIVMHHPIDLPLARNRRKLVPIAEKAIKEFSAHSVDMYLSGHYHRSSVVSTSDRYAIKNYSAIAAQAGTLSVRARGELQSFNVIEIDKFDVAIKTYRWSLEKKVFAICSITNFNHHRGKWTLVG